LPWTSIQIRLSTVSVPKKLSVALLETNVVGESHTSNE